MPNVETGRHSGRPVNFAPCINVQIDASIQNSPVIPRSETTWESVLLVTVAFFVLCNGDADSHDQ